MRYHCPVFGVFKFSEPKRQSFQRRLAIRTRRLQSFASSQKASSTNWNSFLNPDINVYAKALINKILDTMKQYIPNKVVFICPSDSWMTSCIRKRIRKRKKAYRKGYTFPTTVIGINTLIILRERHRKE